MINRVRTDIGVQDIWMALDETTNSNGQYVADIIVGKLSVEAAATPHLLASKILEKCNNVKVARFINEPLGNSINYKQKPCFSQIRSNFFGLFRELF